MITLILAFRTPPDVFTFTLAMLHPSPETLLGLDD
jgi:hypothetical protein